MKRFIIILAGLVIALVLLNHFANPQRTTKENTAEIPRTQTAISRPSFHPSHREVHVPKRNSTEAGSADEEESDAPEKLSREQINAYLLKTKRSPESLLNAFWETGDTNLLDEAVAKDPENPLVQWAKLNAVSAQERGPWLEKLKLSSPENALPNYLSALDSFKAGNTDKALSEMDSASSKTFSTFEKERMQSREEMFLLLGYSPLEAREAGMSNLSHVDLLEMKRLANQIGDLQKKYTAAGDQNSAQQLAMLGIEAGRKLAQPNRTYYVDYLIGFAMESVALQNLNADTYYDFLGKTAGERLNELKAQKEEMSKPDPLLYFQLPDSEKLIYWDRVKVYGEAEALRWLDQNYGGQTK